MSFFRIKNLIMFFAATCCAEVHAVEQCQIYEQGVDLGESIFCNPIKVDSERLTTKTYGEAFAYYSEDTLRGRVRSQKDLEVIGCNRARQNAGSCRELDEEKYISDEDFYRLEADDCSQEGIPEYWRSEGWRCFPGGKLCSSNVRTDEEYCSCRNSIGRRGVKCKIWVYCSLKPKQECFPAQVISNEF